ncbi:MAG: ketohydroxyglutarate aldolase [Blastocatellia bacterium]
MKNLKQAGMTVENELKSTGIVTGSVDETKIKHLRAINGVATLEPEQSYQIAPPDSDVQ